MTDIVETEKKTSIATTKVTQTAGNIYNIKQVGTLNLQQFFVSANELIPLECLRFDLSHYNLFVVSEKVKESGSFSLSDAELLKNNPNKEITPKLLKKSLKYPSVIASINDDFITASDNHIAYIGLVFNYEHSGNHTKFWYTSSVVFKQEIMNVNPDIFAIAHSEQRNKLDYCHWEIKDINLLKALNLEKDYNCEE